MRLLPACPPSCKRLRVDDAESDRAQRRHGVLELVDEMVEGGMRRGDALDTVRLAKSTCCDWRKAFRRGGLRALEPRSTRPRSVRRRRWIAEPRSSACPDRGCRVIWQAQFPRGPERLRVSRIAESRNYERSRNTVEHM